MAGDISKLEHAAKKTLGALTPVSKKMKQEITQIAQDVVEKLAKQEKIASQAAASQGQAMVNLQNGKLIQEITQAKKQEHIEQAFVDGYASARAAVKKTPLPLDRKEELVSNINAQIESRHVEASLSKKSAQNSAEFILQENPVDLEAKKQELMSKHGEKYRLKKQQEAEQLCEARKEHALKTAVKELRRDFIRDTRDFTDIFFAIEAKIPKGSIDQYFNLHEYNEFWKALEKLKSNSKNMTEFTDNAREYVAKAFTNEGLSFAKKALADIPADEVSPRITSQFLSIINGEIESRITTQNLGTRTTQEIKEAFEDFADKHEVKIYPLDDEIAKTKARLWEKHGEQFENRPGRKSAKVIMELSPVDLEAKKIELRKKFGNQQIIKSFMLEKKLNYDDAKALAYDEIEKYSKLYRVSMEEAEAKMERRANVVIELLSKMNNSNVQK